MLTLVERTTRCSQNIFKMNWAVQQLFQKLGDLCLAPSIVPCGSESRNLQQLIYLNATLYLG